MTGKPKGVDVNLKFARMIYYNKETGKTLFSAIPCSCDPWLSGDFFNCQKYDEPIVNEVFYARNSQSQSQSHSQPNETKANKSREEQQISVLPSYDSEPEIDFEIVARVLPVDQTTDDNVEQSSDICPAPDSPALRVNEKFKVVNACRL